MTDLEISSRFVGAEFRTREIEVTARRAMNFAAGVLDSAECYFDDLRPQGIIAHPMLACALTWPTSSKFPEFLIAEGFPMQVIRRQVHYTETLIWARSLKPGDLFTIHGQIVAILPHRAGTHLIVRYEGLDQNGHSVFTEYTGAMLRGVRCTDDGESLDLPDPTPPVDSTQFVWEAPIDLHPMAAHLYDGCADISFPIHSSVAFAKSVGLPGIIMQGTATASYAVSELIRRESGRMPEELQRLDCRFTGMAAPGTQIVVQLSARREHTDYTELFWSVADSSGRAVISDGRLRLKREK